MTRSAWPVCSVTVAPPSLSLPQHGTTYSFSTTSASVLPTVLYVIASVGMLSAFAFDSSHALRSVWRRSASAWRSVNRPKLSTTNPSTLPTWLHAKRVTDAELPRSNVIQHEHPENQARELIQNA